MTYGLLPCATKPSQRGCNLKGKNLLIDPNEKGDPIEKGGKMKMAKAASPESLPTSN